MKSRRCDIASWGRHKDMRSRREEWKGVLNIPNTPVEPVSKTVDICLDFFITDFMSRDWVWRNYNWRASGDKNKKLKIM